MDQKQKTMIAGIGLVFLASASVFLLLMKNYDPPKMEEVKSIVNNFEVESKQNQEKNSQRFVENNNTNVSNSVQNNSDTGLMARVVNEDNLPVIGLRCDLFKINKQQNQDIETLLFSGKTNNNGECYFYDLEARKAYKIDFSSEKSNQFYLSWGISDLPENIITFQQISTEQNMVDGKKKQCADSDGGYEPFVFGYVIADDKIEGPQQRTDDLCIGNSVMEVICDQFGYANNAKTYQCPNGCQGGACIK